MRLFRAVLLLLAVSPAGFAQKYLISTFAGGGLPVNLPGTSANLGTSAIGGLASDPAGNLYFPYLNAVLRWDAKTRMVTLAAGGPTAGYSGDGGLAIAAQLNHPSGVALNSHGDLYIADSYNQRIRKVTGGVITTVAGSGDWGYTGDNGPATEASFGTPSALAIDSADNLYIADSNNYAIRELVGQVITTVAGNGTEGYSGDQGPATAARLGFPTAIAVDPSNNLYISDDDTPVVREVSHGIITTIAGTGHIGYGGDGGPPLAANLGWIYGLATDSAGNLYLADEYNGVVREISHGEIATVAGDASHSFNGDSGPALSIGLGAYGLALDGAGNLYIADADYGRIREVSHGTIATRVGGGSPGDGNAPTSAQLAMPRGLALDAAGNLYIGESGGERVRLVKQGTITTVAGNGTPGYSGDNHQATSAQLSDPMGVAVDSHGNLYIAEAVNNAVREVANGVITTLAGNGHPGSGGDGQSASNGRFDFPWGIALDSAGNLYIADTNNQRIRKIAGGVITTVAGNGTCGFSGDNDLAINAQLWAPHGVAVDSNGVLYIADSGNGRLRKVAGGVISTVAGGGTDYSGDNVPATSAAFGALVGVAVDSAGALYLADDAFGRVRKVTGGTINTIAGGGSNNGENIPATSALLSPEALAVDPAGHVYLADTNEERVYVLSPYTPSLLSVSLSHTGNFAQGQTGATYTVKVSNAASAGPTTGAVTLTDIIPSGLILESMAGDRWTCAPGGNTCVTKDILQPGAAYPSITVTVDVAAHAATPQVNSVSVSGGGSPVATYNDSTAITQFSQVTIQTSPAGLQFTLDGGAAQTAPVTVSLSQGSHTLAVAATQAGAAGTQYVFTSWSDGHTTASDAITVGTSAATYTASFQIQYRLTTAVSPPGDGSVSANPSSSGYYNAATTVHLTATPAGGYQFTGWSGDLSGSANPQSIAMNAAHTVTANFATAPPASCTLSLSAAANLPPTGTSTVETCPNNSGQPNCGVLPETPATFTVTPSANCGAWTATSSNPEFLQITSGAAGTGAGTVSFSLLNNTHHGQQSYTISVATPNASAPYAITEAGSGDSQVYREVYALYEQLLGRDPDSGGFAFWTGSGGAGLGQMADSFLTSPEAFNSDFAAMAAYQATTNAPPTFALYTTAVAGLRGGAQTLTALFNSLTAAGYSATTLYQNLLGRQPTAAEIASANTAGLAQWFQTLIGYPATLAPVSAPNNEFQGTGSFHADHTNALYMRMVYYVTVSRDPDPDGFTFWLGVANSGGPGLLFQGNAGYPTRIQILGPGTPNQGFIGSQEFQGLFQN